MSWNCSFPFAGTPPERRNKARMRASSASMLKGLVM
jgi:hypothetical protein